jgi:two-component sensor histidine kinase
LLHEAHHRMANALCILASILRREFALLASPELQESLLRFEARIVAFGNLHRSLVVAASSGTVSTIAGAARRHDRPTRPDQAVRNCRQNRSVGHR